MVHVEPYIVWGVFLLHSTRFINTANHWSQTSQIFILEFLGTDREYPSTQILFTALPCRQQAVMERGKKKLLVPNSSFMKKRGHVTRFSSFNGSFEPVRASLEFWWILTRFCIFLNRFSGKSNADGGSGWKTTLSSTFLTLSHDLRNFTNASARPMSGSERSGVSEVFQLCANMSLMFLIPNFEWFDDSDDETLKVLFEENQF